MIINLAPVTSIRVTTILVSVVQKLGVSIIKLGTKSHTRMGAPAFL